MKTTLDGDKLYFENSGNMTKIKGYVKDCDDGAGKDIVFETDGCVELEVEKYDLNI